jgi:hypothetical protein
MFLLGNVDGSVTLRQSYVCKIGKSKLIMQTDGNLVLYDETGRARWAANWTRPNVMGRGYEARFQVFDNNFVVYSDHNNPLWASNTWRGERGGWLAVQADGNVVVYDPDLIPLWATNTAH